MPRIRLTEPGPGQMGLQISGYASLFGQRDRGGDVVRRGAFAASLARTKAEGGRVQMLWQHDPAAPVGIWDEVREDEKGLFVRGRILPEAQHGTSAAGLVKAGVIDGLSIGYQPKRLRKGRAGERELLEVELWEVSLVTFPMLQSARLSEKSTGLAAEIRALRGKLRGFSLGVQHG